MAYENMTLWKCDACGNEELSELSDKQEKWARIAIVQPPRASFEMARVEMHLCRKCLMRVLETMSQLKETDAPSNL